MNKNKKENGMLIVLKDQQNWQIFTTIQEKREKQITKTQE